MKKLLILPAFAFLASCGGMSVCDCVAKEKEMRKEMEAATDDEARKKIEEKYKSAEEECKKMVEGKTDEEKKKLMEEAEKCEK